jgi:hypothetical protein
MDSRKCVCRGRIGIVEKIEPEDGKWPCKVTSSTIGCTPILHLYISNLDSVAITVCIYPLQSRSRVQFHAFIHHPLTTSPTRSINPIAIGPFEPISQPFPNFLLTPTPTSDHYPPSWGVNCPVSVRTPAVRGVIGEQVNASLTDPWVYRLSFYGPHFLLAVPLPEYPPTSWR